MYWAAGASIALFSPADFVETDGILEAAEDGVTAIREQEVLAGDEVTHPFGNQDLLGRGVVADAACELDGGSEQVVVFGDGLACVDADLEA